MLIIFIVVVVILTTLFEYLIRKKILGFELSRKILHTLVSTLAALSVFYTNENVIIIIIGFSAFIILSLLIKFDVIKNLQNERKSWGITYLALAYLFLGVIWQNNFRWLMFPSLFILAFADALAALIGKNFAVKKYKITDKDFKSYLGSSIFFIVTFILLLSFSQFNPSNLPVWRNYFYFDKFYLIGILCISIVLTVTEAVSTSGSDNFTVPVIASVLLYAFFNQRELQLISNFTIGLFLSFAVTFISFELRFLTFSGTLAAFILATIIYGFGGIKWTLPILMFFILSSFLSKVRLKKNSNVELSFDKSGTRDSMQVFSNGGIAGILMLIYAITKYEEIYLLYIAAIAIVCADTWSTEIGTIKKHNTFNILNLQPIEQGQSGGISVVGTLGGLLGASLIAFIGILETGQYSLKLFIIITLVGLVGSLFDSLIGATLQILYKCNVCGKITERKEHCGNKTVYFKGIKFINNDFVNFSASIMGVLFMFIFNKLL